MWSGFSGALHWKVRGMGMGEGDLDGRRDGRAEYVTDIGGGVGFPGCESCSYAS